MGARWITRAPRRTWLERIFCARITFTAAQPTHITVLPSLPFYDWRRSDPELHTTNEGQTQ